MYLQWKSRRNCDGEGVTVTEGEESAVKQTQHESQLGCVRSWQILVTGVVRTSNRLYALPHRVWHSSAIFQSLNFILNRWLCFSIDKDTA